MIKYFDHVTVCVRNIEEAKQFFSLLGFEEDKRVIISGEQFASYMGVEGIEADHLTLIVPDLIPRLEVQILHYRTPEAQPDPLISRLDKLGFNHICFAVDDAEDMVKHLKDNGVEVRSELKLFHNRQLFFLTGPEGITVELAQWR
jgi:catechol 2,3-dioxygenase-like lactoylglutathione lyase family enzyme